MITTTLLSITGGILIGLIALIAFLPSKVEYVEFLTVEAPVDKVYNAIRFQEQLMAWSAWPKETNSLCEVANSDGQVGAQTVFLTKKKKKIGYQEIYQLKENEQVSFKLFSFVAPHEKEVKLHFYLKRLSEDKTQIMMHFQEEMRKPQFLIAYIGGIIPWVREMHLKDLAGLKSFVEAPSSTHQRIGTFAY